MRQPRKDAFTLVELLVVIGIIGLLIGILLPALTRARAEGKRAMCLSNLRTLGQCYLEYLTDSRGRGLFTQYVALTPPPGASFYSQYWFASSTTYPTGISWDVRQGYLGKYFKNPAFLSCPAASEYFHVYTGTGAASAAAFADAPLTTYGFNANICTTVPGTPLTALTTTSRVKNASETCALIDAVSIVNDLTGTLTGALNTYAPYKNAAGGIDHVGPSFHGRHAGRGSVLWYDGHASTETPYITTLAANVGASTAWATTAGKAAILRAKVGYLTPSTASEAQLLANFGTSNNLSYYYWADKSAGW